MTLEEKRFWGSIRITDPDSCWLWLRCRNSYGYGVFCKHKKEREQAHRYAYKLFFGPIPSDRQVLHRCDEPACCNPSHLFLGTQHDNISDMLHKGRHNKGKAIDDFLRFSIGESFQDIIGL